MRAIDSIAEFLTRTGDEAPTTAERAFIEAVRVGEPCILEDGTRPDTPSDARTIRAGLLSVMILGGTKDCRTADWGIYLEGAYIPDALNLYVCTARGLTGLSACHFAETISALLARFESLNLSGSRLPGLNAQDARVAGSLFLRARDKDTRFEAEGEVSLAGAQIGGQLECVGARLVNAKGSALNAEGARVTGAVFLRALDKDTRFEAEGEVSLAGAHIKGQLDCVGASFDNPDGRAVNAQNLFVTQGLLWRDVSCDEGEISFHSAHVGDLADDPTSWPDGDRLILDGFTYDRIAGAPTDAETRLEWLKRGSTYNGRFFPQPYVQLARVLRAMGHRGDARRVLVEMERRVAADRLKRDRERLAALWAGDQAERGDIGCHWLEMQGARVWAGLIGRLVGYGHAPGRVPVWFALYMALATAFYFAAWNNGGMVPNSAIILTSPDWAAAMAAAPDAPGPYWAEAMGAPDHPSPAHYETFNAGAYAFNAGAYAFDVFVPLVDLGQEAAWTATTANGIGLVAWVFAWIAKALGWLIAALGAAAVTGIIRHEDEVP